MNKNVECPRQLAREIKPRRHGHYLYQNLACPQMTQNGFGFHFVAELSTFWNALGPRCRIQREKTNNGLLKVWHGNRTDLDAFRVPVRHFNLAKRRGNGVGKQKIKSKVRVKCSSISMFDGWIAAQEKYMHVCSATDFKLASRGGYISFRSA